MARVMAVVEDIEPSLAVNRHQLLPVIFTVFPCHRRRNGRTKLSRIPGSRLKEASGFRFTSIVVNAFENHRRKAVGLRQRHSRRGDRSIAVPPQHAAIHTHGVQKLSHLLGGNLVKSAWKTFDTGRLPVIGPIRNQNSKAVLKRLDLRVERIHLVSPSAVQKQQRNPMPIFAIKEAFSTTRIFKYDERHKLIANCGLRNAIETPQFEIRNSKFAISPRFVWRM